MYKIGIDVGGTFTDFVVIKDDQEPQLFKTPTTPSDPSIGVITGLQNVADAYDTSLQDLLGLSLLFVLAHLPRSQRSWQTLRRLA